MNTEFAKKTVVITGGARGIGHAVRERFAASGAHVVVADNLPDTAAADLPSSVSYYRCDVSNRGEVETFARDVLSRFGRVDVLINNAATGFEFVDLVDMDFDDWDAVQETNLKGPAMLANLFLKTMTDRRSGVIVNIASAAAFQAEAGHTAYAASKAGLVALTRCLAREVGRYGVRVVCVVHGWIATESNRPSREEQSWLAQNVSLGRAGTPGEVAEVVWFLASDAASYITGQCVFVDGGGT